MKNDPEKMAHSLNALVQKNSDAEKGFEKAAEITKAKSLSHWFEVRAEERRRFREQLKDEVHSLGYPCVQTPSLTGDLHRTWMEIKAAFTDDDDEAMLAEAMRGEKAALEEYNEILSEMSFSESTQKLLKSHREKLEEGLAVLRTLDDIEFQEDS